MVGWFIVFGEYFAVFMHYLSYYPEWPFKKKKSSPGKVGMERWEFIYIYKKEATNRVFLGHPHKHQINNLGEIKKKNRVYPK